MEIEEFQKLDLTEYNLEVTLNVLDEDDEGDWTCLNICGLKKQVLAGRTEIDRIHPLIPQGFSYEDGEIRIFPKAIPTTVIDAEIKSYRPIFGGDCSLVLGETNDNSFIFFDPDSRNKDYQKRISKLSRIIMIAVSEGGVIPIPEDEIEEVPSYWRGWRPCLYEAVFTISKELERVNNFARVEVNNPLDKNRTLDLLLNYAKIDDPQTEKVIETDFIFSGTLV